MSFFWKRTAGLLFIITIIQGYCNTPLIKQSKEGNKMLHYQNAALALALATRLYNDKFNLKAPKIKFI